MSSPESERTLSIPPGAPTDPNAGEPTASDSRDPDDLAPGTAIGSYVIESTIGSGGGGTVFLAEHPVLGRRAAIKVLRAEMVASKVAVARFLREARVMNMIRHPAIVDIYEFSEMPDGRPYFVMELLEGGDLKRLIAARGRFPPEEVLDIVTQVCSALTAAHSAGVVHRDLKASNIHVAIKDGRYVIKLLDFGIAKLQEPGRELQGLTRAGTRLGTATSMAPEQIRGEVVDHRADVYALGILIYHMLTGRYPFRGGTPQETDRLSLEAPPPRPSQLVPVGPEIDAVVLKCLEKLALKRFDSASAVEEALRKAVIQTTAPAAAASTRRAVGVCVEAQAAQGSDGSDEGDEVWLDDVTFVLDAGEAALQTAGLEILLHTTTSLLGVRLLSDNSDAAYEETQHVLKAAVTLAQSMEGRSAAHPNVRVCVRMHVDDVEVDGAPTPNITGGVITDVTSWPEQSVLESTLHE